MFIHVWWSWSSSSSLGLLWWVLVDAGAGGGRSTSQLSWWSWIPYCVGGGRCELSGSFSGDISWLGIYEIYFGSGTLSCSMRSSSLQHSSMFPAIHRSIRRRWRRIRLPFLLAISGGNYENNLQLDSGFLCLRGLLTIVLAGATLFSTLVKHCPRRRRSWGGDIFHDSELCLVCVLNASDY